MFYEICNTMDKVDFALALDPHQDKSNVQIFVLKHFLGSGDGYFH